MRAGSTSDGENRGGQTGAGEQENDKQREVELETDEHGQNKWEEVKGTEQVCVVEDWQMGTRSLLLRGGESQAGGGYFSPCSTHCFSINTGGNVQKDSKLTATMAYGKQIYVVMEAIEKRS